MKHPRSLPAASKLKTERKLQFVSEAIANTNGKAATNGHAETNGHSGAKPTSNKPSRRKSGSKHYIARLIDQATKFRTAAHDLMHEASHLVRALKQHRSANKAVENTLATLKSLGV